MTQKQMPTFAPSSELAAEVRKPERGHIGVGLMYSFRAITYGRFLYQCVNSVLGQVGVDVRVLVIDDASSDNTAEVAGGSSTGKRERLRRGYTVHSTNRRGCTGYTSNEANCMGSADYEVRFSRCRRPSLSGP